MDDRVNFVVRKDSVHGRSIAKIRLDERDIGVTSQLASAFDSNGAAVGKVIDDHRTKTRFDERNSSVGADVSGSAGDEDVLHWKI